MEAIKEYEEGYKLGLDNSNKKCPYSPTGEKQKHDAWIKGYNIGYREFINWVNLMCN